MSKIEKDTIKGAKHALAVIDELATAGVALASVTGVGGPGIVVLGAIAKITKAVAAGFEREISPDEMLQQINAAHEGLADEIAADDAAADRRVEERFETKTPPGGYKLKPEPGAVVPDPNDPNKP